MSIDIVALLRGPAPSRARGVVRLVEGGCLFATLQRWIDDDDELAFVVRSTVGDALDAHDDPRGVLVFPDVAEPAAPSYDGVVAELGRDARWVPRVSADWLPPRLRDAREGTWDAFERDAREMGSAEITDELMRAQRAGDADGVARAVAKLEALSKTLAARHDMDALVAAGQRDLDEAAKRWAARPTATPSKVDPARAKQTFEEVYARMESDPAVKAKIAELERQLKKKG